MEHKEGYQKKCSWKLEWLLFITFFKIAPATFGGGYAVMPAIEREIVEKRKWMGSKEIADLFSVAQSIPGAIAINSATFIGLRIAGIRGAIFAMMAMIIPTFIITVALSLLFMQVKDNPKIEAAFIAIRPAVVAMIIFAAIKYGRKVLTDITSALILILTVVLLLFGPTHMHPILILTGGALIGVTSQILKVKLGKRMDTQSNIEQEQMFDYMI